MPEEQELDLKLKEEKKNEREIARCLKRSPTVNNKENKGKHQEIQHRPSDVFKGSGLPVLPQLGT